MEIIQLDKNFEDQVKRLNIETAQQLENDAYFIPFTNEEIELLLTAGKGDLFGVIENEKLAAISGLLFDLSDFLEEFEQLGIKETEIAEIGGCMTNPDFRNKGLMYKLNTQLIELAKMRGLNYVFATAHPDNFASNKSLQNLNMEFVKTINREGKLRNLYIFKLA